MVLHPCHVEEGQHLRGTERGRVCPERGVHPSMRSSRRVQVPFFRHGRVHRAEAGPEAQGCRVQPQVPYVPARPSLGWMHFELGICAGTHSLAVACITLLSLIVTHRHSLSHFISVGRLGLGRTSTRPEALGAWIHSYHPHQAARLPRTLHGDPGLTSPSCIVTSCLIVDIIVS